VACYCTSRCRPSSMYVLYNSFLHGAHSRSNTWKTITYNDSQVSTPINSHLKSDINEVMFTEKVGSQKSIKSISGGGSSSLACWGCASRHQLSASDRCPRPPQTHRAAPCNDQTHSAAATRSAARRKPHPPCESGRLAIQPCLGILITFFSQSQRISADPLASCCKSTAVGLRLDQGQNMLRSRGRCSPTSGYR
jgi:hypothetical protein